MAAGDAYLERLDAVLLSLFAEWNVYTTIFATALFVYLAYPWLTWRDPDTHPLLLARQASTSPIRQPKESAVYRSIEVPYGYPLRAGLGVKDPEAPKWSSGRNGDLRDIWRTAARGSMNEDSSSAGKRGKVITVLGNQKLIEHDLDNMTIDINVIGKYVQDLNGQCAAICLSNSAELLSSIFAAAFYGFRPVLVPHNLDTKLLIAHLSEVAADFLIAEAGAVEVDVVVAGCPSLRHIIWVAKEGNRHMDWNVVPEGTGSTVEVVVWHELVDERKTLTSSEVPSVDKDSSVQPLSLFWPGTEGVEQLVEYTSENLISATAALMSALPRTQRISADDLLLPTSSLVSSYSLCLTFAALYSNASVALNSVAGEDVEFSLAASGVGPTIIVTSSRTILDYHSKAMASQTGLTASISRFIQKQSLQAGNMPSRNAIAKLAEIDTKLSLSKLRLLFVAHRVGDRKSPKLQSSVLTDLRMLLGARIGYALTAPQVAGAVCQTNVFDYRQTEGFNRFGPPLSSVEVNLSGDEDRVSKQDPRGKLLFPWIAPYFPDHTTLHAQIARGGRSIVITADDEQARHTLTLMLILRRLGCNLPIEVTYFGDGDLTEDYRVALERFPDVVTRDLISTIADTECGSEERWAYALSWSAKLFALLFSSFREAILIDADASFLQNPQVPFDNTAYVQTGALFFHGRLTRPWSRKRLLQRILPQPMSDKAMGSRFLESESKHMQESGVVVVDRWRHFMALSMVARINGSEHNRNAAEENIRLYETPYGHKETYWITWEFFGGLDYLFHAGGVGVMGNVREDETEEEVADEKEDEKAKDEIIHKKATTDDSQKAAAHLQQPKGALQEKEMLTKYIICVS